MFGEIPMKFSTGFITDIEKWILKLNVKELDQATCFVKIGAGLEKLYYMNPRLTFMIQ